MVQENFKKVEKANWLKIIFNSARFLISLLVLNIGVVLLFTVEISRNFYVSTVVIFIVLLIILGIADFFVFSYYKNLQYFLSKEVYMVGNTFTAIFFKSNEGKWEKINAGGYKKDSFDLFQEDFVKQNYLKALENIENGGNEEFSFRKSHKLSFSLFSDKKQIENLDNLKRIKVSKENIIFDDEIYNWEEYIIGVTDGVIFVKDLNDNIILAFGNEMEIFCENLLVFLIGKLNKN